MGRGVHKSLGETAHERRLYNPPVEFLHTFYALNFSLPPDFGDGTNRLFFRCWQEEAVHGH